MADIAELGLKINSNDLSSADAKLDRFSKSSAQAERASDRMAGKVSKDYRQINRESTRLAGGIDKVKSSLLAFVGAAAAIQVGRGIARMADDYTNLNSKIGLVTKSEREAIMVRKQVIEIANKTRSGLQATGDLYTKLARSTHDMNLSQQEMLRLTETINKSFIVSGASAAEADAAIVQLGQGLASGALRGDEFNSVAEQAPILMDMLSKSLGMSRGELREFAAQGKITSEVLVNALAAGAKDVDQKFSGMQMTIAGATQQLKNNLQVFVGEATNASGASTALAAAISIVGQNIGTILNVALIAGIGHLGKMTIAFIANRAAAVQSALAVGRMAEAELIAARAAEAQAAAEMTKVRAMQAAGLQTAQMTAATNAYAAAQARLAEATTAANAVMVRGAAVAGGLGRGLLALVGGPIGAAVLAIGAVGYGIYKVIRASEKMRAEFEEGIKTMKDSAKAADDLTHSLTQISLVPFKPLPDFSTVLNKWRDNSELLSKKQSELIRKQNELAEATETLRISQTDAGRATDKFGFMQSRAESKVAELKKEVAALESGLGDLSTKTNALGVAMEGTLTPALRNAADAAHSLLGGTSLDKLVTGLAAKVQELGIQSGVLKDNAKEWNAANKALGDSIVSTEEKFKTYGKTQAQIIQAQLDAVKSSVVWKQASEEQRAKLVESAQAAIAHEQAMEKNKDANNAAAESQKEASETLSAYDQILQDIASRTQGYQDTIAGLTSAQVTYREEVQQLMALFVGGAIGFDQLAAGLAAVNNELGKSGAAEGMAKLKDIIGANNDAIAEMQMRLGGASRSQITLKKDLKAAEKAYTAAGSAANASGKKQYQSAIDAAKGAAKLRDELGKSIDVSHIMDQFTSKSPILETIDHIKKMREELEKVKDPMNAAFNPERAKALEAAIKAAGSTVAVDMVGSFKSLLGVAQTFEKQGSSGFKNIEKAMAALSIVQDIIAMRAAVIAVLTQAEGEPYSAFARMAAMAAAVAPFLASIGLTLKSLGGGGGKPSSQSAEVRQASQGTGSVLGDSEAKSESIAKATELTASATEKLVGINRGMLNALQSLQQSIGGASGMLARGAGDMEAPSLRGGIKAFSSINRGILGNLLFGGKQKLIDQGILIAGGKLQDMLDDIVVGAYQTIKTSGGLFSHGSTKENTSNVSDKFSKQFQLVIGSIIDTVTEGAKALGIPLDEINAKIAAFQVAEHHISLKGLSAEDQQKEIEAVFSKIFDDLAGSVVPFVEQFQKVGEGLGETLVRVATEVQVMQEAMKQLGLSVATTDPEQFAQISDALIEASGGIDKFIEGMQSFASTFAPESFQFDNAQRALESALSQVNLSLPDTTDGMWALMQTLDASTESGRQQIATLLRLSDTAKQYYDLLDKRAKASLDYAMLAASLQAEAGLNPLAQDLLNIAKWSLDTTQKLNDLAKAAGMAGAKESDLALVHTIATKRAQAAIQALMESSADLVSQLYGPATDAASAVNSFGSAMTTAASKAKDAMSLLLGDLSPYSDRQKLDMALQGQRAGTVTPDEVLQIGRRLFASTSQYKQLFDQVMAVGDHTGANTPQGRTATNTQEIAKKTLSKAERYGLADQLANNIADLASAQDISFKDVADKLGLDLSDLGKDLGLDNKALNDYLTVLASDNFGLNDLDGILGAQVDRLIAAITGQPYNDPTGTTSPLGDANSQPPVPTGTVTRNPVIVNSSSPDMLQRLDAISAGLKSLETKFDENGKLNGRYLPRIAENTERGAEGTETVARNTREMVAVRPTEPRSTRSRNLPVGA